MKKLFLTIFSLLTVYTFLHAQQSINFQGKIYSSGIPVNNSGATFIFYLTDNTIWGDTISNVPVVNGLYAVTIHLPQNVFDSANSSRQMVVRYNGNRLDTVTLYAPIERDPTVRSYIRDSVLWGNIRNKPTIDTSYTNELQNLSLSGDTLRISNGNSVLLPLHADTLHGITVNGNFTVVDTAASLLTAVPFVGSVVTGSLYWQSFKATANGKLRQLRINIAASGSAGIIITIYSGQGNTTSAIAYKVFTVSNSQTTQTLDLSSGLGGSSSIALSNGQVYTFEIKPSSTNTVSVLTDATNPYPYGISSINATTDIPFELTIDNSTPACLTFDNNCRVGIGTNTPTAQLEVKGRVKDQTGFLMPVGTVISYAGRIIPQGWLLCDGSVVSRTAYADLFEAIDTSWGSGTSIATFRLPDLRGQFLRGVDTSMNVGSLNNDPDHASRIAPYAGANTGNNVGSRQADMLASHNHSTPYLYLLTTAPNPYIYIGSGVKAGSESGGTNYTGGNETRPRNSYVYYIIKY